MSAIIGAQAFRSEIVRPVMPPFGVQPMPIPRLAKRTGATPTQLKVLDLVRNDIRAMSSVQPIHKILASPSWLPTIKNPTDEIIDELADLRPSKFPLAVKSFIVGAGLAAATLFATSNTFPSPDNKFGGILIGLITLLSLPIIGVELTGKSLNQEFKLIPLESDNLPSLRKILDRGCTPEQFGAFVNTDLLPRIPIGHARSLANDYGTTLHDIMFWKRDDLHFEGTTWETVYKVINQLGVGDDVSLRVKAGLLMIERDAALDDTSLSEINAALEALASIGR